MNWHIGNRKPIPPGYRDTVSRVARELAQSDRIDDDYAEVIAIWQIVHDCLRGDYTVEQWRRYELHIRVMDAGLDLDRIEFAVFLVKTGAING